MITLNDLSLSNNWRKAGQLIVDGKEGQAGDLKVTGRMSDYNLKVYQLINSRWVRVKGNNELNSITRAIVEGE